MNKLEDRIGEILDRISTTDLLAEYGHTPAKMNAGTFTYHCPFPSHDDRSPSFTVKDGHWKCWSQCGLSGDVIDLVVAYEQISKSEAIERLAARVGLERETPPKQQAPLNGNRARDLLAQFVAERQWSPEAVAEKRLSVVLDSYGRPRVRFPYLYSNDLVWWQDRALNGATPKWLNPKGKTPAIYNAHALQSATYKEVTIVEGPSDVMALCSTFQSPCVVGIPGSNNFLPAWSEAFKNLTSVIIFGDNDAAGEQFRATVDALLRPLVSYVVHPRVPAKFNDIDEWRRQVGNDNDKFGMEFSSSIWAAEGVVA